MQSPLLRLGKEVSLFFQKLRHKSISQSQFLKPQPQLLDNVCHSSTLYPTTSHSFSATPLLKNQNLRNDLSYGQPSHGSHPELFPNPLDIIPGISSKEFKDRRTKLGSLITRFSRRTTGEDLSHMIIIPAASKKYMTENIPYPFRQNSNFFYLTGSYEPEAVLVIVVYQDGRQTHSLFLNDGDSVSDLWEGRKTSKKGAIEHFGLDEAYSLSNFDSFVRDFGVLTERKFLVWCEERSFFEKMRTNFLSDIRPVQTPKGFLHSLRVKKSHGEVKLMRESCRIASEAFQSAISFCSNLSLSDNIVTEGQIWAKLDYEVRMRGAERLAYPPVVASGDRANIIHYVHNKNNCQIGDMVLIDAGCEVFGYCSDITRTFPVSGKFSNDHHRSLYELVLEVQEKLISKVEPGITLEQLFRSMGPDMLTGLQQLGILDKSIDTSLGTAALTLQFCPHHCSHYLGMDIHDTSAIDRNEPLQPGMIITVEPGIYINAVTMQRENLLTKVGKEFDGIGIRIEDDVLVTSDGRDVLSAPCPKTIQEIEYWGSKK